MPTHDWDERHAFALESGNIPGPSSLIVQYATPLQSGRALDLACGLGRHSLWLARRGWQVTAVDASPIAINSLGLMAAKEGLPMDARVADLEHNEFLIEPDFWDLIVVYNYLQRDLFPSIRNGVMQGGMLLASVLLADTDSVRFGVKPGELRGLFNDWEIQCYKETAHAGHATAELAARKICIQGH